MEIKEAIGEAPKTCDKYYLDGQEITLIELEEKKRDPKVKVVLEEGSTNQYKTKQRLYD